MLFLYCSIPTDFCINSVSLFFNNCEMHVCVPTGEMHSHSVLVIRTDNEGKSINDWVVTGTGTGRDTICGN